MSLRFTFNNHENLKSQHALFSPSQSSWLRYEDDKIAERILNQYRAAIGTEIHEFAAQQIELRHKQTSVKSVKDGVEDYIYTKYKFSNSKQEISDRANTLIDNVGYLPKEVFETVKYYVNDGIGFGMRPEQIVWYSDNVFGTADTIIFKGNQLRIHDLKTGAVPAHMEQLESYAALFCLEYRIKPSDINIELRIYQSDGIMVHNPTVEDIVPIMDKIISIDKIALGIEKERRYE